MPADFRGNSTNLQASFPQKLTIPNGQATSNAFDVSGFGQGGFIIPAAFTGTAVTFQVSADDALNAQSPTYFDLYDKTNTKISITVATSRAYPFPPEAFDFAKVKIVSNQNEGAARTIEVFGKF